MAEELEIRCSKSKCVESDEMKLRNHQLEVCLMQVEKLANDIHQQITFAQGGINTNDMPCNTRMSYKNLETAQNKWSELQKLIDKTLTTSQGKGSQ